VVGRVGGGVRIRPAIDLPPDFAAEMERQGLTVKALPATERVLAAMIAVCRREGRPASRKELVTATGIPFRTVADALVRLVAEGRALTATDPRNPTWQLYIPKGAGK